VDTQAAALAAGVKPSTIRTWADRGLLSRHGRRQRRTLYDLGEVLSVADRNTPRSTTVED
jgi:DNA-binding transcriptional MerR regulator